MTHDIQQRAKKLIETPIRVFPHASFKDAAQRQIIIGDMPRFEKFKIENEEIKKMQSSNMDMRPCYESPLLDFEQEQHLFRKMNYYKFRAKKLISKLDTNCLCEQNVAKIERCFAKALQIKNQIAEANFRLVTSVINKCQVSFYRERNIIDALISNAYFDVLKSIDYFDWTRGIKFSTYAIWVMKRNYFKDLKDKKKYAARFVNMGIEKEDNVYFDEDTLEIQEKKDLAERLLTFVCKKEKMKQQTADRIVYILQSYFGFNGSERRTLESISEEIGVTKERVRQLKEEGLTLIKNKAEELGIKYEMGV